MTVQEWREQSHPVLLRIFELELKAEDYGLTEAEQLEYATLQKQWHEWIKKLCDVELKSP